MVDVQTAYYMVAATGVLVAAIYYIYNVRITQRNMKATLETRKMQFLTEFCERISGYEGSMKLLQLINMQWSDWDDFEKKYGSDNNIQNCAMRNEIFGYYELLGDMLKEKMVDANTLYSLINFKPIFLWAKFKGYYEYEKRQYHFGKDLGEPLEYLAQEMLKVKLERAPDFNVPENFITYVPPK